MKQLLHLYCAVGQEKEKLTIVNCFYYMVMSVTRGSRGFIALPQKLLCEMNGQKKIMRAAFNISPLKYNVKALLYQKRVS